MAFLDNSGDIILDAVLTDTGRFRLAKGDGTFKIVKFALSDDEINYRLYDKNHSSGSAYYDLEILQTPVMEAFTNNTSTMNYKLLSMPRTNLLYLPIMKINSLPAASAIVQCETQAANDGYVVTCTDQTWAALTLAAKSSNNGIMDGSSISVEKRIRIDQGIDNTAISYTNQIDVDLKETQYIIEIDSRLGSIISPQGTGPGVQAAALSFIDDDNIASYYLSTTDGNYVQNIKEVISPVDETNVWALAAQNQTFPNKIASISGPQGTCLQFTIKSSLDLISSDFLFDQLGATFSTTAEKLAWFGDGSIAGTWKYIDTTVKVSGATTGYRIDIPVRFIKCTTC